MAKKIKKRTAFRIFFAVEKALFLRELNMRFSAGKSGLFWTFFQPFIQILVFIGIKVALFGRSEQDYDFTVFLALNFTAFNMFKNIVFKSTASFKANKALFIYKQVKPIDTIIARTIVEVFITSTIIIFFILIGLKFDFDIEVKNLNMVLLGFAWFIIFSFSFALFIAVFNTFFQSIGKIMSFMMTGLMFGSAIFYVISSLPPIAQTLLLYNPLTHFMEMLHGFYFIGLDDSYVNYNYMALWTLGLLYCGLWLYHKLEKRIISL